MARSTGNHVRPLLALLATVAVAACAPSVAPTVGMAPSPDPRVGLKAGLRDAGEAIWNLDLLSATPSPEPFASSTNSDLAFSGKYAIQGNYSGYQVWDLSNPRQPVLAAQLVCPASQSDVSVYGNLLFVSGEGLEGRLDCAPGGVRDTVSAIRLRGLRIFDISDIKNPRNVGNVQTCRGSHTHTVLKDPKDDENVYVYISGSAPIRSPNELPGCVRETPDKDPNSALFRIEVIKVPLKDPARAAIVSSPRIFNDLVAPPRHGDAPEDKIQREKMLEQAKRSGAFVVSIEGQTMMLPPQFTRPMLDSIVKARGGSGAPTAADSATLRGSIDGIVAKMVGLTPPGQSRGPRPGPTQCHDITVYPAIGLAGGACEGYGLLLDIRDPVNPKRIAAVADSNFAYWHSATFSNDGSKVLFTDEWGGGGGPKCRATDPKEWGANAIFAIENGQMVFQSYYKMPAPQTNLENCVAHNGKLIPVPGRDIMVQSWYQGGISVFDWTDAKRPVEIAFHDRGPIDGSRMGNAGSWSVYWYNGLIVSSEIGRGLDVFALKPSAMLTQNEIDAANTVRFDFLNPQGQPKIVWPASFALARAYVDQLERSGGVSGSKVKAYRAALAEAEAKRGAERQAALKALGGTVRKSVGGKDSARVTKLAEAVEALAAQ
ncbi:MAG: LVIVD repeat-containing protein [Gemmatimonadaceae bacterium]